LSGVAEYEKIKFGETLGQHLFLEKHIDSQTVVCNFNAEYKFQVKTPEYKVSK
jgi:hypothetical protein